MPGPDLTDAIARALGDPAFHADRPANVEHVQTHLSHVFLAGPRVYKLKKPVRFPFVDYSTPDARHHFCLEEVRLNQRLAPGVYRTVAAVTRAPDGTLALDGPGEVVDHVVVMRRLPEERTLESLVRGDAADAVMLGEVARVVHRFHTTAARELEDLARAEPDAVERRWSVNVAELVDAARELVPAEDLEVLVDFGPTFVRRHESLLRARRQAGRSLEGHGDLRADHVYVLDAGLPATDDLPALPSGVYVVDCVEFSREFRSGDVAADVGFLVMSLEALGRPDLGRALADAYVAAAGDSTLASVLGFYVTHRACIRAKVSALTAREPEVPAAERERAAETSRAMLRLASRHAWRVGPPALIACTGLSGTGKSALAEEIARATGFTRLATDVLRADVPPPPDEPRYSPRARAAVYERLLERTDALLAAGAGVVADATFQRAADRRALIDVAHRRGASLLFVECRAPEDVVRARLDAREASSLSDARFDTYVAQRATAEPLRDDEPHVVIDTGGALAEARAAAVRALWRWRQGRAATSSHP